MIIIYLREISKNDLDVINKWRNDPELMSFLGAQFRFINYETDLNWYENYMKSRANNVRCVICYGNNESNIIGSIGLINIDYVCRKAEFYIMIGNKENQNKGYGYEAAKLMLKHAFCNLNLQRVELTVLEYNVRAKKLYDKIGFKVEGVLRNATYKNGKYENLIIMSILKEEFIQMEERIE